jgi:C4-dicarboxylate-specific signal transduction histidine kinase
MTLSSEFPCLTEAAAAWPAVAAWGRTCLSASDGPRRLEGVIFDVTKRGRAQEESQRHLNEMAHLARLTAIGELVASIAHDLSQPLGAILSNASVAERLLAAQTPDLQELRDILADIREDVRRADAVIQSLRALLRRQEVDRLAQDLNELVRATVRLVDSEAARRQVAVRLNLASDLPLVSVDRVQIQQVLLNLIVNGLDAMAGATGSERELVVQTEHVGDQIEVAVSDLGTGFPEGSLEHVFDAFYTTKKEGLGLGLSIARSIIESHGGRIEAQNRQEGGATVRFALPCAESGESGGNDRSDESLGPFNADLESAP